MTLEILTDNKSVTCDQDGKVCVKISPEENNGVYIGSDGKIHTKKGNTGSTGQTGSNNIPGNMVEGTYGKGIGTLRCNKYVTRLHIVNGDIPDVVCIEDVISHMLGG